MNSKKSKIILGIDPGTNVLGFGIIKLENNNMKLLEHNILLLNKIKDYDLRLKNIYDNINLIIQKFNIDEVAIEAPFYGKNIQSMLKLGRAQGVAIIASINNNKKVFEYAPRKIKLSVTGSGNSSKNQVASMLISMLKIKEPSSHFDATDGLAVAVCHALQNNLSTTKQSKKSKNSNWSEFVRKNPDRLT